MAQTGMVSNPALKETYLHLKTRMDKAVEDFRANLAAASTGRASVHMLDTVKVACYGSEMPLNQVSNVHAREAHLLTVHVFNPGFRGGMYRPLRPPGLGYTLK